MQFTSHVNWKFYFCSKIMGKVRKLRKKYKALSAKNDQPSSQTPSITNDFVSILPSNEQPTEPFSNTIEDAEYRSVARSSYSISKSIKSSLGGMSIQKKDKQKLRHELFLKRLDASKEAFDRLKSTKKRRKEINFKDDLPPLKLFGDGKKNSDSQVRKQTKTIVKNVNQPRKGLLKHRTQQLAQNLIQFREKLKSNPVL